MSNPFDGLTYMAGAFDLPPGWKKTEDRMARKAVVAGVGKHGQKQEHLNSAHRRNKATLFDDDGELIQTADMALYRFDTDLSDYDLMEQAYQEIALAVQRDINAVKQHIEFEVIGGQQDALDMLAANPVAWGEGIE